MERLKGKKIIIYGDERYSRDFLYIFEKINPAYVVDDKRNQFCKSFDLLLEEDKNCIFVIICKYDEQSAEQKLELMGLKRNISFASATTFFELLDYPLKKISKERKVFVWGTGVNSCEFFHDYVEENPDVQIVGCIDSNVEKKGTYFFNRPVYLPDDILKKENIFVVIASKKYYWEIKNALKKAGKTERSDFINYLEIHHKASKMLWRTIYDTPRLNYVCPKAFQVVEFKPEGKLLICGGMPELLDKNVPLYYTDLWNVWHSNIMKVIRLSFINGTYTFCNPNNCCYLENTRNNIYSRLHIFNESNYEIYEENFPKTFQCGWDESCNLHCPSCRKEVYMASGEKQLELQLFSKRVKYEMILPYAEKLKVAGLGEVFASEIYKDLIYDEEIAAKVKKIGILSNGSLFTKDKFDKLVSMWETINVFISMDGAKKETIEKLRAGINYERWLENMKYLGKMKVDGRINLLAFNFVVQRENYQEMADFVEMCLLFHADQIKFSKVFNWGYYTEEEFKNISMFDENNEMLDELKMVVSNPIFKKKEVHLFRWINW